MPRTSRRRRTQGHVFVWRIILVVLCLTCYHPVVNGRVADSVYDLDTDAIESFEKGKELLAAGKWNQASLYYWRAVLLQSSSDNQFSVEEAFSGFMQCYAAQGKTADGFVFIAKESINRGQREMAKRYAEQALMVDPMHEEAQELLSRLDHPAKGAAQKVKPKQRENKFQPQFGSDEEENPLYGKSPEDLYEYGSRLFSRRNYEHCADVFELSCKRSQYTLGPACSNAVYCRMMILDWGFNGTGFDSDMERIEKFTKKEVDRFRLGGLQDFQWQRATSVHPHMMLGYPVEPKLKRYVAESVAFMDEAMARVTDQGVLNQLPDDVPFDPSSDRAKYIFQAAKAGFKLKVGFVGSGFNSKAVLYLSQDIFRFYDRSKIEMHIFSMGSPDNEGFIRLGMRGVDWRKRVQSHVDRFHDVENMKMDHIELARYIHRQGIHVLIEWDGYARQGDRAQGLFALRPAPVQILHQEYLGTSGAQYVDYIFTDKVTSPLDLEHLYTEKFIYMPNHFFSKGHAVQKEVVPPRHEYLPAKSPYELGTGSPQENRCGQEGVAEPSFVFCNFNKFLKNNPETMRSWIRILREVPGSILCLLENPTTGVNYMRRFVHEASGTPITVTDPDSNLNYVTFEAVDGDALNDRIHFLPWERNPFDHQQRNQDFCNVMLDSYPYNGHTVAQDSLYGGVPIITRSDGDDMSSRVSTSANVVLGLQELNAYNGPKHYEDIAIDIGMNRTKYEQVRRHLVDTALQRNPMHPYWDVPRYVLNFESGLMQAWDRFLSGLPPDHITIVESDEAKRGTYDEVLINNPSDPVQPRHGEL